MANTAKQLIKGMYMLILVRTGGTMNLFGSKLFHEDFAGLCQEQRESRLVIATSLCKTRIDPNFRLTEPVQVTNKTACMNAICGKQPIFVKCHFNPECYAQEMLFYTAFSNMPFVPELLAHDDLGSIIVLQHVGDAAPANQYCTAAWVFWALGKIHGQWERIQEEALWPRTSFNASKTLAQLQTSTVMSDAENAVVNVFRLAGKGRYMPVAIGDVQPAHVRMQGMRRWLVDFDTLSIGRWDAFDLVMALARFPIDLDRDTKRFMRVYEVSRRRVGSSLCGLVRVANEIQGLATAVRRNFPKMCHS